MKLTVVGCASAYTSRPGRVSSSYLIEHDDTAIVLDMGQGAFSELWRYWSPGSLAAVLISHMHGDHNVDLIPLRHWVRYANAGHGPALHGPTDLRDRYSAFQGRYSEPSSNPDFFADLAGDALTPSTFSVGGLTIEARHVTHIPDSFAFRVSVAGAGSPGLVYSGDCGAATDLDPLVRPDDTLLCEAGLGLDPSDDPIHLTAMEAAAVATRRNAGRLVLTHIMDKYADSRLAERVGDTFSGDILVAEPGLALDIR
jgi:ribonuclease BN (tRNA processing enzyme)